MNPIIKKPSAWFPVVLSLVVLAAMFIGIALSGPPIRQLDEGTGAHLFQIWLVLEVFMVAFFGAKWLSQAPKQALVILAIQIIAIVAACAPVAYFHL